MYSGFDPNTPSFPFFNSLCYCRPYFVIPFNLIAVHIIIIHIIIIIIHSYYPNVVFVCVCRREMAMRGSDPTTNPRCLFRLQRGHALID